MEDDVSRISSEELPDCWLSPRTSAAANPLVSACRLCRVRACVRVFVCVCACGFCHHWTATRKYRADLARTAPRRKLVPTREPRSEPPNPRVSREHLLRLCRQLSPTKYYIRLLHGMKPNTLHPMLSGDAQLNRWPGCLTAPGPT